MIANPDLNAFASQAVVTNLRDAGEEFSRAERKGNVTDRLARKYHRALSEYGTALQSCPYSPSGGLVDPSGHDVMMIQKVEVELLRMREETKRILARVGGSLSLEPDADE